MYYLEKLTITLLLKTFSVKWLGFFSTNGDMKLKFISAQAEDKYYMPQHEPNGEKK